MFMYMVVLLVHCYQVKGSNDCSHPKGSDGESYTEGCLKQSCKNGSWRPSLDGSVCCYEREPFKPGSIISSTTSEDGCTTSSIECKIEEKDAKLDLKVENNCRSSIVPNQMEAIEQRIETFAAQLDMVDAKVYIVDEKVDTFENKMNVIGDKVDTIQRKMDMLRQVVLKNTNTSAHSAFPDVRTELIEKEALLKDITLDMLNKEGEVFMEKESFEEGQVLVKLNGTLYDIIPHLAVLSNMTMFLETVSPEEVVWQNEETFDMSGHIFTKVNISNEKPEEDDIPEPGIYVKTKSGKNTLILVYYSAEEGSKRMKLMGMKLTGSAFVPSGMANFEFDFDMSELVVQHAYKNFVSPYWNRNYEMMAMEKYFFEMTLSSSTMNMYNHISRFEVIVI